MDNFTDYDQYIQNAMQSWSCPGLALAVVRGDDVIYQRAFGLRDVEGQLPMTDDARFPMASITKAFTAMSLALLVDEGKLEWDKPVREYMPEFILDDMYATRHVTVRDMMCHRTGLPRHDFAASRLDISRAELVKRMKHLKFSATFRERFQYNNLMYYVLPYLVEKIAGEKWEDFMQRRVFAPLKMTASNFTPESPVAGQFTAQGYRVDYDDEGKAKGVVHMPFGRHTEVSPGGAGALFSTLADMIQWMKVHVNEGRAGDVRLVSPGNLKQMHLPHIVTGGGGIYEALMGTTISTYGLGWGIEPYRGHTLIQHSGGVEGHSLMIGFVPQEKTGVVALTNVAMMPLASVLLYESLDRALGLPGQDWNTKFHGVYDPMIVGMATSKQTTAQEKVENAPPTHPLEAYAGKYKADGYPDIAVRLDGDGLQLCLEGSLDWSPLRHYHYDVFEWDITIFDTRTKLRFLTNDIGEIDSVSIPLEPFVDNIVFTRKPLDLGEDILAALVGEYDTPIDGFAFTVTAREGKVYFANSDSHAWEITAYKLTDDVVGFKSDGSRRYDFVRENGVISRITLIWPDTTIEARRK
jgi:CubicO group peptidase (beta-lactamase class C family)